MKNKERKIGACDQSVHMAKQVHNYIEIILMHHFHKYITRSNMWNEKFKIITFAGLLKSIRNYDEDKWKTGSFHEFPWGFTWKSAGF